MLLKKKTPLSKTLKRILSLDVNEVFVPIVIQAK